ncbi:ParA family protein [Apilactobacillus timberlakei]|uniref:ParA family protein n=1 Tax=Apilactobacillus timberlakei TaxID=2008380 RepID=A0ABY2YRW7_9LACO|nr:ParA family protein [Apilactobacillus timberlakei]TPR12784.1 ParA family protein [Apilactobacillus timberlakei]TPR13667.1 ParA family protein [Apilactobacillus timberlakei]
MQKKEILEKNKINSILNNIKSKNEATTILVGNQKGGVGKTTNSCLIAYTLANMGIKTLVADLDPQSNSTKMLVLTRDNVKDDLTILNKTIMSGIEDNSLEDLPINIMDNLDLLPSHVDFKGFPKYIYKNTDNDYDEDHVLEPLFKPLKKKYDVIILDTPPLSKEINDNAVIMSDYVLISLQTQQGSLDGATDYINDTLIPLVQEYDLKDIEVVGILPMLTDDRNRVDNETIEKASESFGEKNMFKNVINQMARIKRFPVLGITNDNMYEHRIMHKYQLVTNELILRIGLFMSGSEK